MSKTIDPKVWQALEGEGHDLRSDYSGRGMYDDTCIGMVGSLRDFVRFMATLVLYAEDQNDAADVLSDLASAVNEDSMGRDSIYYFPGWTVGE